MQFDHFNISAPIEVLDKEKAFFCDAFGLENGFRPDFSKAGYWLYSGDKAVIHLSESEQNFANEKPAYLDHIAFQLQGVNSFIKRLESLGVTYRAKSLEQMSMTQVFFKTPAGIKLEVNFVNEFIAAH